MTPSFFSSEETRMQVHGAHTDGEAKFWLEPKNELALNQGLSQKQVNEALVWFMLTTRRLSMPGVSTLEVEVSLVSNKGFWLLLDNEEQFIAYAEFPWFKQATVDQITTIERPSLNHLYWPMLDVDFAVESIRNPGFVSVDLQAQRLLIIEHRIIITFSLRFGVSHESLFGSN